LSNFAHKINKFTYADYCTWDDGNSQRWELIDGEVYAMASPGANHQRILLALARKIGDYLDGKKCELFVAPFDVRLNHDKGDDTVVQPDLFVVCDPKKVADNKSCKGAPELVIEILSPSTTNHDKIRKFAKYREAGVDEIWFTDPTANIAEVFQRGNDGQYAFAFYDHTDKIIVGILPELEIDLNDIFPMQEMQENI